MSQASSRVRLGTADRFNQNGVGQLFADTKPCVADLANESGLPGQHFDLLVFTQTHLSQTLPQFRGGGKMFDAHSGARLNTTQRADLRACTLAAHNIIGLRRSLIHWPQNRLVETKLQEASLRGPGHGLFQVSKAAADWPFGPRISVFFRPSVLRASELGSVHCPRSILVTFAAIPRKIRQPSMYRDHKVVVVMPAYNAARTLRQTYSEVREQGLVDTIILVDDGSRDDTVLLARQLEGVQVHVHDQNRGYGANQKTCYRLALDAGADVVIMIHPDYQYTPKLIPAMVSIVASGLHPCVLGSRILGGYASKAECHSGNISPTGSLRFSKTSS